MVYENRETFEKSNMFGTGVPNTGYAQYFIGDSFLNPLTDPKTGLYGANVKHWHGAKKNSWFSHLAMEVPGEGCSNEWCEPVTDEEYNKL